MEAKIHRNNIQLSLIFSTCKGRREDDSHILVQHKADGNILLYRQLRKDNLRRGGQSKRIHLLIFYSLQWRAH